MRSGVDFRCERRSGFRQLPQHGVQNSAVSVVDDFNRGIDPASGDEVNHFAVWLAGHDFDGLSWGQFVIEADVEGFRSIEAE